MYSAVRSFFKKKNSGRRELTFFFAQKPRINQQIKTPQTQKILKTKYYSLNKPMRCFYRILKIIGLS